MQLAGKLMSESAKYSKCKNEAQWSCEEREVADLFGIWPANKGKFYQ